MGAGLLAGILAVFVPLVGAVSFLGIVVMAKKLKVTPAEVQAYRKALGLVLPSPAAIWQSWRESKL